MSAFENPALRAFAGQLGEQLRFAQVLIRRDGSAFELRHVDDSGVASDRLESFSPARARELAQFTPTGEFRPLKSAPTLRHGWLIRARDVSELGVALDRLYPGAVADWFAALAPEPPVTNWRDFAARQSGMYRITTMLGDAQLASLTGTTCAPVRCLKRRLWSAPSAPPESAQAKSLIPCLEPCALMLEAARVEVRREQEGARAQAEETGPGPD